MVLAEDQIIGFLGTIDQDHFRMSDEAFVRHPHLVARGLDVVEQWKVNAVHRRIIAMCAFAIGGEIAR